MLIKICKCCLNDALQIQVEDKAKNVGVVLKTILPDGINYYLNKDKDGAKYAFLIDEYFEIFTSSSFSPAIMG